MFQNPCLSGLGDARFQPEGYLEVNKMVLLIHVRYVSSHKILTHHTSNGNYHMFH